jgi:hypothetical protein
MKKRGRKLGWWKIWTPDGLRDMTEAEESAIKQRRIQQHGLNAELTAPWKDLVRSERLARLSSPAVADKRLQRVKRRKNVEDRNVRIHDIAKKISDQGWRGKSNSWIASRLAGDRKRSVNTIRADVAAAKKFLMGSQKPNN